MRYRPWLNMEKHSFLILSMKLVWRKWGLNCPPFWERDSMVIIKKLPLFKNIPQCSMESSILYGIKWNIPWMLWKIFLPLYICTKDVLNYEFFCSGNQSTMSLVRCWIPIFPPPRWEYNKVKAATIRKSMPTRLGREEGNSTMNYMSSSAILQKGGVTTNLTGLFSAVESSERLPDRSMEILEKEERQWIASKSVGNLMIKNNLTRL